MTTFHDIAGAVLVQGPSDSEPRTIDLGSDDLTAALRYLAPTEEVTAFEVTDADDATIDNSGFTDKTVTVQVSGVTRTLGEGGHRISVRFETSLPRSKTVSFLLVVPS